MPTLQIIIASTRPGRVGLPVGRWFESRARAHGAFDVEVSDLAEIALPFMDEPNHPRLRQYTQEHTRAWSARIEASDAFVFVMPEYNHGLIAPLKNAIDYLHQEWLYKPVGLVSYGGVAAGTRAAQMVKQVVLAVKMTPLFETVAIPFVAQFIDDDGAVQANEVDGARGQHDARRARARRGCAGAAAGEVTVRASVRRSVGFRALRR